MPGVIAWRNLETAPKPGNKAKSVGDALRPARNRFDWCTKRPPLSSVRTQYGPGSTLSNDTDGVRLRVPCAMLGRLKLLRQSNSDLNRRANTRVMRKVVSAGSRRTTVDG